MSSSDRPSPLPPVGFQSWLDYAVEHFDTRQISVEMLLADDSEWVDRAAIRNAARKELDELRAASSRDGAV